MTRIKGIIIAVLVVAVLAMAAVLSNTAKVPAGSSDSATAKASGSTKQQVAAGHPAPDFTLQDLNGQAVKLSALRGKPVILNFWASWCGPCKEEMPDLEGAYKAYQGKIDIYGVNLTDQDQEANARQFLKENGITFPVLLDPSGQVNEAYHIINVPSTIAIDKDGVVREVHPGQLTRAQMDGIIERDMAGK